MKLSIVVVSVALVVGVSSLAFAQERRVTFAEQPVPAPSRAFELQVATGYTQGFGMLESGVGLPSVARGGIGVELGAGYRADPHWAVNINTQYQELQAERGTAARGLSAGIAAQYHFAPQVRMNPWVELGSGYRLLWEPQANELPTALTHGFQLARLRAGLDVRGSTEVAVSPFIGADINTFLWQDFGGNRAISDPRVSTFIFAGVQGRLDLGGTPVATTTVTSADAP